MMQALRLAEGSRPSSTIALLDQSTVRPVFHGVAKTDSLLMDAVSDPSDSGAMRAKLRRHVGIGYLVQLCLTSGPLMFADLALLAAAILVPKFVMQFFGSGPRMDLSACFLPIASGFLLICAELGLYPGIRLSPVDELRRLAMAVTSIFRGLERQRCDARARLGGHTVYLSGSRLPDFLGDVAGVPQRRSQLARQVFLVGLSHIGLWPRCFGRQSLRMALCQPTPGIATGRRDCRSDRFADRWR